MHPNGVVYEYIAVYVDDLAVATKQPKELTDILIEVYKFKLKGTGPIQFHLGMDFFRDEDGVLCFAPRKYIKRMEDSYLQMYGCKPPQNMLSPLEANDHPELDDTELLDEEGIQRYQSMVGQMQWSVSIGCIDITTAVMSLSSFRTAPHAGHMECAKRMFGYLIKMKDAVI